MNHELARVVADLMGDPVGVCDDLKPRLQKILDSLPGPLMETDRWIRCMGIRDELVAVRGGMIVHKDPPARRRDRPPELPENPPAIRQTIIPWGIGVFKSPQPPRSFFTVFGVALDRRQLEDIAKPRFPRRRRIELMGATVTPKWGGTWEDGRPNHWLARTSCFQLKEEEIQQRALDFHKDLTRVSKQIHELVNT